MAYAQFLEDDFGIDLAFQDFAEELAGLPGRYAAPEGEILIARDKGGACVGCIAFRRYDAESCEMKRLYVRPSHLGRGVGKKLALRVIESARTAGYVNMRLDTLDKLRPALSLYTGLGFQACGPYYKNPLSGVIYMEMAL